MPNESVNPITAVLSTQISDREAIIYMLVESGMSYRDLAGRLGMTHGGIAHIYEKAKKKFYIMGEAEIFATPLVDNTTKKH